MGLRTFLPIVCCLVLVTVYQAQTAPVARDDFYVVDKGQYLEVGKNDDQPSGYWWAWGQPFSDNSPHVAAPCQGLGCCAFCPYANPPSNYTNFELFRYFRQATAGPIPPNQDSNTAIVGVVFIGNDDAQNAGSCKGRVPSDRGQPVNATNGNMWLEQQDYSLPGAGEFININRFYNSIIQSSGLFGFGWTTQYDESIQIYGDKMIRYNQPEGRAAYFGRVATNIPYKAYSPDLKAEVVVSQEAGNTVFTLTHKDGRSRKFSSTGKLLSLKDANGNETVLAYNGNGHLTTVTDPTGRTLTLTPNTNGTISQINDSMGVIADYVYETFSGVTVLKTVTFPDGAKYKFFYTTRGTKVLLETVKDALDNVLETHDYDSQGRATTSEKHGGVEKYIFTYPSTPPSADTPVFTTVTDALGRVTKYHYLRVYGANIVTKTEGVCGSCGGAGSEVTEYKYDNSNSWLNLTEKIQKTETVDRKKIYTYDSDRNVTQIEEKSGTTSLGIQKWTYNSFGQITTYKDRIDSQSADPNLNTVTNTYSPSGNLLTTTVRNVLAGNVVRNETTTFTHKPSGQIETIKDALNNTTTLAYDSQGRLTKIKDANNKETNFGYDARARVTNVTNAMSEVTSFEYDLNNRLKKVIYPDTKFILNAYDLAGRKTGVTDERNNTTIFAYDEAYRLISITDPLSHAATFGYDIMSNMTSQTDALGNITNLEYDDFNRVKKVIYPAPLPSPSPSPSVSPTPDPTRLVESLTYDKLGNIKTRVNTDGKTTSYDYDNLNRLIKITDALGNITEFEYNLRFQMTKVKDALTPSQEYLFSYDVVGHILSQVRAGSTMTFAYDAVGNRTSRTDYNGRQTTYEYDVLNRLKKINYLAGTLPGTTATYTYDDLSRPETAVNQNGTVAFTYDNRNRLKTETDVWGKVVEYGYDAASNRTLLKLDGSNYATYAYDNANRLTGITNSSDSTTITYGHDVADRLTSRVYPNGVTTTYEYDGMSRLKRLKDVGPSGTLFDRQYSYNAANQISQIAELTQTRDFTYDNIDRLTAITNGTANESYSYNPVGNRTASHLSNTYTHQPFNKLTATQTASYGFDANGNTTTKSEGSQFWRYGWDHENRMVSASTRKQSVRYRYDALGRRIERNLGTGRERTRFTYDGNDVILDDNKGTLTKYLNGEGIDNKLRSQTGSSTSYFLADHLGSTNGLADSTGAITSQTAYDSFGNQTASLSTRYGFTGRERDDFTGLMYYRARFFDPKLGRFISEDPIGFGGGEMNLYGYVRNRPLAFRDPTGKFPVVPINVVGGVVAAELALHYALIEYADRIRFSDPDALGRKRHCWINCMSTRIHLGIPAIVGVLGGAKEIHDLIRAGNLSDSLGDLQANSVGQLNALIVWKGCQELCDACKF